MTLAKTTRAAELCLMLPKYWKENLPTVVKLVKKIIMVLLNLRNSEKTWSSLDIRMKKKQTIFSKRLQVY